MGTVASQGDEAEERPARRRIDEFMDEDDDYEERRRRRRRKKSNAGLIWGLVGGLVGLVVLVVVAILIINAVSGGSGPVRSWSLGENEKKTYSLKFNVGKNVEIWVKSNDDTDVDLFVFPPGMRANFAERKFGKFVMAEPVGAIRFDDGDSKNCYVNFVAPATGSYDVVVWNRKRIEPEQQHRNKANSGTLEFKESDLGAVAANPPPPNVADNPPANPDNPPIVPPANPGAANRLGTPLQLNPGMTVRAGLFTRTDGHDPTKPGCFCKIFACNLVAGKTYTIDLETISKKLDPYLRIEDANGQQLAFNDDADENTLNSRIVFQPPQNGTYKIIATTLAPGMTGPFTLKIRQQ